MIEKNTNNPINYLYRISQTNRIKMQGLGLPGHFVVFYNNNGNQK